MAELVSLAQIKSHLDIPLANTSQDPQLTLLNNVAGSHIESYCARVFAQATYDETFDGSNMSDLAVKRVPITSVTSLFIDPSRVFDATTLIDVDDFTVLDDQATIRLHSGKFPRASQSIRLVYTAGYATIPYEVQYAALIIVELLYRSNQDRRVGRKSIAKNGEVISYAQGWPEEVLLLLAPFRYKQFAGERSQWSL